MSNQVIYVVISRSDGTTLGPFDTEEAAIAWAKTATWQKGFFTRRVYPLAVKKG